MMDGRGRRRALLALAGGGNVQLSVCEAKVIAAAAGDNAERNVGLGVPCGGVATAALAGLTVRRLAGRRFVDHSGSVQVSRRVAV